MVRKASYQIQVTLSWLTNIIAPQSPWRENGLTKALVFLSELLVDYWGFDLLLSSEALMESVHS